MYSAPPSLRISAASFRHAEICRVADPHTSLVMGCYAMSCTMEITGYANRVSHESVS